LEEYIIADGYNIINAWPELNKLKSANLEHAREKLVETMANYAALTGKQVAVVFDAHRTEEKTRYYDEIDNVKIIYTRADETADALIERLAGELSNYGIVYVVTFDWAEQRIILGRGAYRLTPSELREQIERAERESRKYYGEVRPSEKYLELRLDDRVRKTLEKWRRERDK